MGKVMDKIKARDKKYAEVRRLNARDYYWKKKGKGDYYYIKRDMDLLSKKLKSIQKIVDRLGLKLELSPKKPLRSKEHGNE